MSSFSFACNECGASYAEDRALYVCPSCSSHQIPGGPTRARQLVELAEAELPRQWPASPLSSPVALAAFLPVRGPGSFFSLAAGGTPLLPVPRLREALGMPRLLLKDDTRNPSGSTKDRASHLVVAKAIEYGYETVAAASTGNAATTLAAAGAAAGTPLT